MNTQDQHGLIICTILETLASNNSNHLGFRRHLQFGISIHWSFFVKGLNSYLESWFAIRI